MMYLIKIQKIKKKKSRNLLQLKKLKRPSNIEFILKEPSENSNY